jgi:hypothetical protein
MIQNAFNHWIHKKGKFTYRGIYAEKGGILGHVQLIYEYTNRKSFC